MGESSLAGDGNAGSVAKVSSRYSRYPAGVLGTEMDNSPSRCRPPKAEMRPGETAVSYALNARHRTQKQQRSIKITKRGRDAPQLRVKMAYSGRIADNHSAQLMRRRDPPRCPRVQGAAVRRWLSAFTQMRLGTLLGPAGQRQPTLTRTHSAGLSSWRGALPFTCKIQPLKSQSTPPVSPHGDALTALVKKREPLPEPEPLMARQSILGTQINNQHDRTAARVSSGKSVC
jgi:hypothetical protein